jgi:ankyrin repeat protein
MMHLIRSGGSRGIALLFVLFGATGQGLALGQAEPDRVVDAVKRQDPLAVRSLLDGGADVNATQGDGATALHWAAYWNDLTMAQLLLEAGARVSAANDLGVTPLWLACNNGSAAMAETLLDAGADPDAALPSGETSLMTASRTGSVDAVRSLLTHGADVTATEGSHGQSALMWAVAQRHSAVVRTLLEHGAATDDRSISYPQVISSSGNADLSGVYDIEQGGYTPLLFAARQGGLESAKLLVAAGGDVNDAAPMGTSALVVAAHSGQSAIALFLLDQGADPNAADAGYTALHAAVLRGDLELVTALLARGADPSPQLVRGTPGRRVSADWTLSHSLIGATPFWLAARFREPAIMRVLAEGGADPLAAKDGATAVMAALQGGSSRGRFGLPGADLADRSEEGRLTVEAVEQALAAGADVDAQNDRGDSAMHIAASRGLDNIISLLAGQGAALDMRNDRGQTPLGAALAKPQGLAALYGSAGGGPTTVALLRELGATDEGTPQSP